jgi:hypothetical protein
MTPSQKCDNNIKNRERIPKKPLAKIKRKYSPLPTINIVCIIL